MTQTDFAVGFYLTKPGGVELIHVGERKGLPDNVDVSGYLMVVKFKLN